MDLRGVAMVTRAGTVRTELAGGLADAAVGVPCTLATRFQICSISKQFAAVAALLLAEAGRLALDDPVDRWLPGGPPQWSRVTLTTGYGYGMFTGTFAGHAAYYHPGDNPGYLSFAGWIPDLSASLVILANDESVSIPGLLRTLLPAALEP